MKINELFSLVAVSVVACVAGAGAASAQTYTVAPTPVYGSVEAQSITRYHGPGLPGGEAQQAVNLGTRQPLFTVAGFNGEIYAPVTPPYNSAADYTTFAGQPERGADAILAQSIDGAP